MRHSQLFLLVLMFVIGANSLLWAAPDDVACARARGEGAIAACGRLIATGGKPARELARIYARRCSAWNWMNEADRAIADCNEATRLDPKFAGGFNNRCWARNIKRETDLAMTDCEQAIRLDPKYAGAYNNRGIGWRDRGDYDRAIADFTQAIRLDPKFMLAYSNRCAAWNRKREPDRAMPDCNEAIRLDPKYPGAHNNRCWLWNIKKEYDRALADCDEAIRLSPKSTVAHVNRCDSWLGKSEPDRALADCDEAIRLNPTSAPGYNMRCAAWNAKKEHDRAIADCNEAIRLDPKFHFSFFHRGNAWRGKGDRLRAVADYGESVRIDPKYVSAFTNRGMLYEAMGRFDLALADFRAVLAINANQPNATERVRRIERRMADAVEAKPVEVRPAVTPPVVTPPPAVTPPGAGRAPLAGARPPAAAPPPAVSPPAAPQPQVAARPSGESRIALVIGNSAYSRASVLPNAKGDAERLAAVLRRIGFTGVTLAIDLSRDRLNDALKNFANEADRADWAVVYFAGHGIELGGNNYLVPTDARLASDRDISFETVALDQVLVAVEGARKMRLVILDACRDNPFIKTMTRGNASRSIGRGLARVEPDGATLVAYAAKAGQIALDGTGANSPFVTALIRHIETPGLEVNFLFRKVRDDVISATGRRQEPFVYGSLPAEEFYFRVP